MRNKLINELKQCFSIKELVCKHCYEKFGESAWLFLSTELLSTLHTLRFKIFKKPIIINNWSLGGSFSQRGLRCNMCDLVKSKNRIYISAHILGKAIDFNVKDLSTLEAYQQIRDNLSLFLFPIRLEANTTTWCHVDVYLPLNSQEKLVEFKV